MIERVSAHKTSDGQTFADLNEAKHHELMLLFPEDRSPDTQNPANEVFANMVMKKPAEVLDILTTTPTSLPRARAIHGGRKTRKAKTATQPTA